MISRKITGRSRLPSSSLINSVTAWASLGVSFACRYLLLVAGSSLKFSQGAFALSYL